MIEKINLLKKANSISRLFQYLEIGQLNGHVLNVLQAENRTLDFHIHEHSDELFYVIEGSFKLEFEDGLESLNQGDLIIVPKGIRHRPVCKALVKCLLIEFDGTLNESNTAGEYQKLEEMSTFFNNRAGIYDAVHPTHLGGGMESKHIIASFLPKHTKTIIDFGIGTGLELEAIYKRFPDIEVTGLDIAEKMLERLKEKYPDKNIKLFKESYLDFDFGDCRYDAAISLMTLHHYDHKTKTELYRKVHNCLNQGGVYIECDYMLHEDDYENAQETEDFNFSEYKRLKDEMDITDGREYHFDTPCTVANQKKMLLSAGFTDVREAWHVGNTVILIADK